MGGAWDFLGVIEKRGGGATPKRRGETGGERNPAEEDKGGVVRGVEGGEEVTGAYPDLRKGGSLVDKESDTHENLGL